MGNLPLKGKTVLITRAREQAKEFSRRIEELGGNALVIPLIRFLPPEDTSLLDDALFHLGEYDWLMFTSANGVRFFFRRLGELNLSPEALAPVRVAAVGPRTAKALQALGAKVDHIPAEYSNEGMLASLGGVFRPGEKVLLPRADIAAPELSRHLRQYGLQVTEVTVYRTAADHSRAAELVERLRNREIDILTFTSSSTVKSLAAALQGQEAGPLLDGVKVVCIGPVTAETARELGIRVDAVPAEYTVDGLIEEIRKMAGG